MISLKDSSLVSHSHLGAPWSGAKSLLSTLTGGALGQVLGKAASTVQSSSCRGVSKDSGVHQELDLLERHVAKLAMPLQELLGDLIEVAIGFMHQGETGLDDTPVEMP